MMFSPPKPEVLQAIPVDAVHRFLTRRGYVQQPSPRHTCRYYEHTERRFNDGSPVHYFFPASNHFVDYPLRVLDFIESQSRYLGVTPEDVFLELTGVAPISPIKAPVPA